MSVESGRSKRGQFFESPLEKRYEFVDTCKQGIPRFQELVAAHEHMRATQVEYDGISEPERLIDLEKIVLREQLLPILITVDRKGNVVMNDKRDELVSRADIMVGRLWGQGYTFNAVGRKAAPEKSQFVFEQYCIGLNAASTKLSLLYEKAVYELFSKGLLRPGVSGLPTEELDQLVHKLIDGYFRDDEKLYRGTFAENVFQSVLLRVFDFLDPTLFVEPPYIAAERLDVDMLVGRRPDMQAPLFGVAFSHLQKQEQKEKWIDTVKGTERQAACQQLGIPLVIPVLSPKIRYDQLQETWESKVGSQSKRTDRTTPDQLLKPDQLLDLMKPLFQQLRTVDGFSDMNKPQQLVNAITGAYFKKRKKIA